MTSEHLHMPTAHDDDERTLHKIDRDLAILTAEVKALTSKLDNHLEKTVHRAEFDALRDRVKTLETARSWLVALVAALIVTAVVNNVLRSPLSPAVEIRAH